MDQGCGIVWYEYDSIVVLYDTLICSLFYSSVGYSGELVGASLKNGFKDGWLA